MYNIVKYNYKTNKREVIAQTKDAIEAFSLANTFDAKCKVGVEENDSGELGAYIEIEDENGEDRWQECSVAACPPCGIFN